ncbi:hypothetical protein RQP46_008098 [Phenoliferia psychrophenolica]
MAYLAHHPAGNPADELPSLHTRHGSGSPWQYPAQSQRFPPHPSSSNSNSNSTSSSPDSPAGMGTLMQYPYDSAGSGRGAHEAERGGAGGGDRFGELRLHGDQGSPFGVSPGPRSSEYVVTGHQRGSSSGGGIGGVAQARPESDPFQPEATLYARDGPSYGGLYDPTPGPGSSVPSHPFTGASAYHSPASSYPTNAPTDSSLPLPHDPYPSYPNYPSSSSIDPDTTFTPDSYIEPTPAYTFPGGGYDGQGDSGAQFYSPPHDTPDPGRELADFFGLPGSPSISSSGGRSRTTSDEVLQDSLMAFEEGSFGNGPGFSVQEEEHHYGGSAPRGIKYQYQLDPTVPVPGSMLPSPASSEGSAIYGSPFASSFGPAHSIPSTTFNSPQPSPHQRMSSLPGATYTMGFGRPGPTPHAAAASSIAPFPFSPVGVVPSHTTSPVPFSRSDSPAFMPQTPTTPSRTSTRSQPNSRTNSFTHLPSFSPYPSPTQRPVNHQRNSSSTSTTTAAIRHHPSSPNLHSSQGSMSRPAPSNGPATSTQLHPTLFDSPTIRPSPNRLRQSLSFPSPAASLNHRRSQSYSTRGVGQQSRPDPFDPEDLSGLGVSIGRRESADSTWSDGSAKANAHRGPRVGGTRTQSFGGDYGWPGPVVEVAGMRERLESMNLQPQFAHGDHQHREGQVVLSGGQLLEDASRQYFESTDRLMEGERAVLVLAPRIAQRSYGTEKRFLCPQPMSLLLGASWWTNVEDPRIKPESLPYASAKIRRVNLPPEVTIFISTDPKPAEDAMLTEWMTREGELVDAEWPIDNDTIVLAGRTTGKSNFVPAGETTKDKRPSVRPLVTVVAPGPGPKESRLIGTFPGKPMHIISKPSKGKLTETSKTCLVHGDLVSLYNRIKSQTASTRFLGVSGNHSSFPTMDWRSMTGGQARPFAPKDAHATTFVARTGRWDAFVIYAVDLNLPTLDPDMVPAAAPFPGYPRPPVNAIPFDPAKEKKIYYNMPIVLQCLSTAVVSPIMIIRKVENRTAIGGGSTTGYSNAPGLPCAPGERLGEAVAQFRPMALEIYTDPTKLHPGDRSSDNTFLACLGDAIGINQSRESRQYFNPIGSSSGVDEDSPPGSGPSPKAPSRPLPTSNTSSPKLPGSAVSAQGEFAAYEDDQSSNGAKVKRMRRLSSSTSISQMPYSLSQPSRSPSALAKHRKRGQSLSSLAQLTDSSSDDEPPPRVWSLDCGDPCVWTIVAIDLARHTFHIPAGVQGGKHAGMTAPSLDAPRLLSTPTPCYPISPDIPVVSAYEVPTRRAGPQDTGAEEDTMLTIHGENLTSSYTVWIGSSPCARQVHKGDWRILVSPPPRLQRHDGDEDDALLRISLVRNDGVIFPSPVHYREEY